MYVHSFYISTIVNKRPIRNFHMNNLLSTYCEKEFSLSMSSQKSFKEPFFQHSKFMEKFSTEVFYGNFLRNFYVEVFYGSFQNSDDIFYRSFQVFYKKCFYGSFQRNYDVRKSRKNPNNLVHNSSFLLKQILAFSLFFSQL